MAHVRDIAAGCKSSSMHMDCARLAYQIRNYVNNITYLYYSIAGHRLQLARPELIGNALREICQY